MIFQYKRKPTIFWGMVFPHRVIEFNDGTAELQKMNIEKREWETVNIDDAENMVLSHLHWLDGCSRSARGYRKINDSTDNPLQ